LPVGDFGNGRRRQLDEVMEVLTPVSVVLCGQPANTEFHAELRVIAHAFDGVAIFPVVLARQGDDFGSVDDHFQIQRFGRNLIGRFHERIHQRAYPVERRIDLFRIVEIEVK
jgi:hypothetical protein